ncbi:hypothetical protein GJ496_007586 [Pomphorhynchus laevis]|nr:hypothetical protein GJ496_007586 [Pomphorhynchus laevis]
MLNESHPYLFSLMIASLIILGMSILIIAYVIILYNQVQHECKQNNELAKITEGTFDSPQIKSQSNNQAGEITIGPITTVPDKEISTDVISEFDQPAITKESESDLDSENKEIKEVANDPATKQDQMYFGGSLNNVPLDCYQFTPEEMHKDSPRVKEAVRHWENYIFEKYSRQLCSSQTQSVDSIAAEGGQRACLYCKSNNKNLVTNNP